MSATIQASRLLRLSDVLQRRKLVAACLGLDLQPIFLSLSGPGDYRRINPLGVSFAKLFSSQTNCFRIHYLSNGTWTHIDLPPTQENYHHVQMLPSGKWLMLRGRAHNVDDKNAHVFDANGTLFNSFHAGDGIEDCQVSPSGQIWVSYFDEGIYSDIPTGRSGLVAFNECGEAISELMR